MPSSLIRSVTYRADVAELEVLFTTGRRYLYFDVPAAIVAELEAAPSQGRYFNTHIRNCFAYREAKGPPRLRVVP